MLQKYQETLKHLLDGVLHSSSGKVTFGDYLNSVGTGIVLLLILLFIVLLVVGVFFVPTKGYKFVHKAAYQTLNEELMKEELDVALVKKLESSAKRKMALFWVGFVVLYIPFAIPTVLYILTLLTGVF